jgi:ATP-dependent DNA helicase RecG
VNLSTSTATQEDLRQWSLAEEGQFLERKSALEGPPGKKRMRKAKDIARDVAETVAAMANADGGELVIGIEDDGTITGVDLPEDKIQLVLGVPQDRNYLNPPVPFRARRVQTPSGDCLLCFAVDWSPTVHQLARGQYLLRIRDRNEPFDAGQIAVLKTAKTQGLWERSFPPGATLADLDEPLLERLAPEAWGGRPPLEILRDRGLVVDRGGDSVPNLVALLLFGKRPSRWHPRCGIDFVRWQGTERRHGADLNVVKRFSIEAPLCLLIRNAYDAIQPQIPERQNLQDLFFKEKLQYPTFAWQEAMVNAVAHRDYAIQGGSIEVWMFDDRLEVRSPGVPPAPVTVEALNRREHLHISRNPLLVRTLVDLGFMRELGEGIPRMFDEMNQAGCYPPGLSILGGMTFQVTLRNQPIYDRATFDWLMQFGALGLSLDQKRVLASAHSHEDRFTNRDVQALLKTDIYGASALIKDLARKGAVRPLTKGSRVYEIVLPLQAKEGMPEAFVTILPALKRFGSVRNGDVQSQLQVSRNTASRLLQEWSDSGWLSAPAKRRGLGAVYVGGPRLLHQPPIAPTESEYGAMTPESGAIKSRDPRPRDEE